MNGLELKFVPENKALIATVSPKQCGGVFEYDLVKKFINDSDYKQYLLDDKLLKSFVKQVKSSIKAKDDNSISSQIGSQQDAKIEIEISEDEMIAMVTVIGAYGGRGPKIEDFQQAMALNGVVRGHSHKIVEKLVRESVHLKPGQSKTEVLAKGLPSRRGKPSRLKPLVANALERILAPQDSGDGNVDMRNLGDIICVDKNEPIAEILPPTKGRSGFTVTNETLEAEPGEEHSIKFGPNTKRDPNNKQLIIAKLAGQPKFNGNAVKVDDVLVTRGVNVKTGNIEYDGAVIVNGDVTEQMKIIAGGDVTINGFVESAYVKSGGDIIITQGLTGKPQTDDCVLVADGNIAVEHAQGVNIICRRDFHVNKQIAHSKIVCRGTVFVGKGASPNGNLFGCEIEAYGPIHAGKVGAVSGSKLNIDYTEGYDEIQVRLAHLKNLHKELASTNADHEIEYSKFRNKTVSNSVRKKITELELALESERLLLEWLRKVESETEDRLDHFKNSAKVIAHQQLFPGVIVNLGKKQFTTSKDMYKTMVTMHNDDWSLQPFRGTAKR